MNRLFSKDEMRMTIRHIFKCSMGQTDSLAGKVVDAKPESHEFDTRDPNHGRSEPTLTRCLLLSTHVLGHTCIHMHMQAYTHTSRVN